MANNTADTAQQSRLKQYALHRTSLFQALAIVSAFSALALACTPVEGNPVTSEGLKAPVEVVKSGSNLKVTNNTDREVFFFACPVRLLPVITYTTTVNPLTATNKVSAKSSKDFAQSVYSLEANDAVHVAWWHLGRKVNDSLNLYNADSVRGLTIAP
ncbi:MAG: hypothetical protein EAZ92_08080 [Candidatus Kapaibacterium sp.]|nr:MAG: hypothetical protein EAZ92_08080 [Candidatus Kapabacteria bacterium]